MKRLNPSGPIQRATVPPAGLELTDVVEIQASLEQSPPAGDRPQYRHHYSPYGGIVAAAAGLFMLVMLVGSVGYWAALSYHWLQQQGGQENVGR